MLVVDVLDGADVVPDGTNTVLDVPDMVLDAPDIVLEVPDPLPEDEAPLLLSLLRFTAKSTPELADAVVNELLR